MRYRLFEVRLQLSCQFAMKSWRKKAKALANLSQETESRCTNATEK